jgi:hypothetical protein
VGRGIGDWKHVAELNHSGRESQLIGTKNRRLRQISPCDVLRQNPGFEEPGRFSGLVTGTVKANRNVLNHGFYGFHR